METFSLTVGRSVLKDLKYTHSYCMGKENKQTEVKQEVLI